MCTIRNYLKMAVAVAVLWLSVLPGMAQSGREITLIEKLARQNDPDAQPLASKVIVKDLTPDEYMRLRILEFLGGALGRANATPEAPMLVGAPLSDREKVLHVLNRLGYGPRPGQVEQVLATGGWSSWVDKQLDPDSIDDGSVNYELEKRFPWIRMALPQIKNSYPIPENGYAQPQLRNELPRSVLLRATMSNRQFKEVICEFWRNHFCVDQPLRNGTDRSWTACHYDEHVIREHAFGKFKEMLFASAHHPAMLQYLDNYSSRAGAWNENYARELMELHTLGADQKYNERDVLELTKVLTGWSYDGNLQFIFNAQQHEPGTKFVMGRNIAKGYGGGQYALGMLAGHKRTATFISEKLCAYLVNDVPPPALVDRVANTFRRTDGDLTQVYREIIYSPEFMSRANFRVKFKTPFEYTVSAFRATDAWVEDGGSTCGVLARMGQSIYNCEDPTGYFDQAEAWMDSGVLTTRWDYSWKLIRSSVDGINITDEFFEEYDVLEPDEMNKKIVADLIGSDIGESTREMLFESRRPRRAVSIVLGSPSFQQQ